MPVAAVVTLSVYMVARGAMWFVRQLPRDSMEANTNASVDG